MAILLQEEGLYEGLPYATDFNQLALNRAKEDVFSSYYTSDYDNVLRINH